MAMRRAVPLLLLSFTLAACEQAPVQQGSVQRGDVQRVALDNTAQARATAEFSPDTAEASWQVSEDGQAIRFGVTEDAPLLSLACDLGANPPEIIIIRHARAFPGKSALFPVIGNGINSRFMADAVLADGEWHWEARLPADDPQLDVFSGTRDMTATLPGRGTLEIKGGRVTGEFVDWCRAEGEPEPVEIEQPESEEN